MNYTNIRADVVIHNKEAKITLLQDDDAIAIIESDGRDVAIDNRSIDSDSEMAALALFLLADELETARYAD